MYSSLLTFKLLWLSSVGAKVQFQNSGSSNFLADKLFSVDRAIDRLRPVTKKKVYVRTESVLSNNFVSMLI